MRTDMAYRNKTYVCFDGDSDIHYYRLMLAWKRNNGLSFDFHDAHDLNTARDSSQEDSIKRQLKQRLDNAKLLVVLIGEQTRHLYKFVRWEMEQAIAMDIPIVGVNLNGERCLDKKRCPPVIREELAVYTSFNAAILGHAIDNWPSSHAAYRTQNKTGPYYFYDSVYSSLGL